MLGLHLRVISLTGFEIALIEHLAKDLILFDDFAVLKHVLHPIESVYNLDDTHFELHGVRHDDLAPLLQLVG